MFKKSFGAGEWLIAVLLYMTFFIFIIYATETISTTDMSSSTYDNYSTIYGDIQSPSEICTTPRYKYNANTGQRTETQITDELRCSESRGVLDMGTCNNLQGCNWTNTTTGWWFWEDTTDASCIGTINASYYGVNTSSFLGYVIVADHNNTEDTRSPCDAPAVILNETACNIFSCTWSTYKREYEDVTLWSVISDVITFNHTFNTSYPFLNFILYFIFVLVPLFIFVVAIYYIFNPFKN